jgi:hypothetical protein
MQQHCFTTKSFFILLGNDGNCRKGILFRYLELAHDELFDGNLVVDLVGPDGVAESSHLQQYLDSESLRLNTDL